MIFVKQLKMTLRRICYFKQPKIILIYDGGWYLVCSVIFGLYFVWSTGKHVLWTKIFNEIVYFVLIKSMLKLWPIQNTLFGNEQVNEHQSITFLINKKHLSKIQIAWNVIKVTKFACLSASQLSDVLSLHMSMSAVPPL